jgi:LSD1 subclass zinc finger protein
MEENLAQINAEIKCSGCGSNLNFKPGTDSLNCQHCGTINKIEVAQVDIEEIDYESFIADKIHVEETQSVTTVKCGSCGASTTLKPNVTSENCPYCDTSLIIKDASTSSIIKPKYLLPFKITKNVADETFQSWLKGLWFAPNDLIAKVSGNRDKIDGVYMPFWTYDAQTMSRYEGRRGEDYTTYETRTVYVNGESKTESVPVTRTNWYHVSGTVGNTFDDVLVCASHSLPEDLVKNLEPWDLDQLVAYDDRFLSGFVTESYQLDMKNGLDVAKNYMMPEIEQAVRHDIGGDHQQISDVDVNYSDLTFKHILLPVWISAFRYNEKVYRFTINARTGELIGKRPYSTIKIVLAIVAVVAIIVTAIILFNKFR